MYLFDLERDGRLVEQIHTLVDGLVVVLDVDFILLGGGGGLSGTVAVPPDETSKILRVVKLLRDLQDSVEVLEHLFSLYRGVCDLCVPYFDQILAHPYH